MTGVDTLRAVPLFAQLRDSDLQQLLRIVRTRDYPRNSVVLFAHDPCDAFYVLLSGQVKVTLISEDGREVILSLMHPGEFFGEKSLLDDEPHSASVIATENSRLLILHRDDFRRCLTEIPGIAFGLLRALCARLRESDRKIGGLVLLDVPGRVAHLLLQLADRVGGSHVPDVPTHQTMAQMVGSSRESVSRAMGAFSSQGVIEVTREGLTILNREALEIAAGHASRKRARELQEAGRMRERRAGAAPTGASPGS